MLAAACFAKKRAMTGSEVQQALRVGGAHGSARAERSLSRGRKQCIRLDRRAPQETVVTDAPAPFALVPMCSCAEEWRA